MLSSQWGDETMIDQPGPCPVCKAEIGGPQGVQWNSASIWCLRCGWAQNWPRRKYRWGR